MEKLAIDGAAPTLTKELLSFQWVTESTISLVSDLLRTQKLSGFLGQAGSQYLGGEWVRKLEKVVANYGNHKHVISFNSWTSGLDAIFIALDLRPASEVIVPTWTMSATISSIVNAGYTPVFADIDDSSFTISVNDVRNKISERTSAICAVDLFGKPADLRGLRELANNNSLFLVSDSAQCPGARIEGEAPSKLADIGGYSLNRHKHIQSGEGGLVVTDDDILAQRLTAIRNHGEVAAPEITLSSKAIYGHNWRLGEIEALIAHQQYLEVDRLILERRLTAKLLIENLRGISGLNLSPFELEHDYYILGMVLDLDIDRDFVCDALKSEGISILISKYSGLEYLPAFNHFLNTELVNSTRLNNQQFLGLYLAGHQFDTENIVEITTAFRKVFNDERARK